ncbi:MAG: DsrE family protein [Desulfovibrio sp.]|nr:DsrE family protein [Desulfovibrio sp.]
MNYDLCLHLDSNDPAMLRLVLKNATNYLNALPDEKVSLSVVVNGPGVVHFATTDADMRQQTEGLMARGVRFCLCANALADNQLTAADLWPGCEVVPAGLVEVVRLQRAGYAYIRP